MKPILIAVLLALLMYGCRRECNCPVDCGTLGGGTPAAIAPMPASGTTSAAAPGATVAAGATAAVRAAAPVAGSTAAGSAPAPAREKEYCASENGDVFHRCSCTSVKRIKPASLVRLPSRAAALASGRRPCKHCKP